MRIKIKDLNEKFLNEKVKICGWIRTIRKQKNFSFIEINDGSKISNFQVIADESLKNYENTIKNLTISTSVSIDGIIIKSPGGKQQIEMKAENIKILGTCPEDYPLQKKRHSFEFLRTIAHLRPRSNTQGAIARVRSRLAFATHLFFQKNGFIYLQPPIITSSDCEGAGEQFQVTTLNLEKPPKTKDDKVDFSMDFFSKKTYLTVSGQLNAESYACGLSDIYTFAPTFRAENTNTSRHLAEFWMIEPEMAFCDLDGIKACAEEFLKFLFTDLLENCGEDINFFNKFIDKQIIERIENVINSPFINISYTEAIDILLKSKQNFEFPVKWGLDLQSEHERFICEKHFKNPVIITDYPKDIKAFYMRDNDDKKTVAAMDVLVSKIGEIVGGSQREERLEVLEKKIMEKGLSLEQYKWYLDLRRYGTVAHSGFGVGFERLVQFATGTENIKDVSAFPRTPRNADF